MTFTPTKNTGKKRTIIPVDDFKLVDGLRRDWLALMPPTIDTITWFADGPDQALSFAWNVAGCARQFMEWTHFQPQRWQAPSWYSERLGRICTWLQAQPADQLPYRREDALKILLNAWPRHLTHLRDNELLYDTLPSLYMPDDLDEFGPITMPLPYLPHWRVHVTPEREVEIGEERMAQRREAASTAEEFTLYSGLVTWLNLQINLPLLDLEENPF